MDQQLFDYHVEQYALALDQLRDTRIALQQHLNGQPGRPVSATLEEASNYASAMRDWKNEKDRLRTVKDENYQQFKKAKIDLLSAMPAPRVWIQSGDRAVGCYGDVWGGWHMVINIRPWSDDLPKLKNRTYYP